ncbi:MAG: TolC family protein [Chitinophagales bacterium]|jgi:outer membrane protein
MNKLVILICLMGFESSIAQEVFTFQTCLDTALQYNLNIQRQQITEKNYKLNIKRAENARLPNISGYTNANANWGRGIDPFTNTFANQQFNTYNGGLNLDLNLFNGFYHINNIKIQKQDLEKNKSEWMKVKNDLTVDIAFRYTNILYLQEMIKNLKEQVAISQANVKFTEKRIEAGTLAKREVYKAIAQKDNEELNLIRAENDLETNMVELKILMGVDITRNIQLKEIGVSSISAEDKTNFIKNAIENSPSLKIQQTNLKKSELNLALTKSSYYPTISLGSQIGSTYSTFNRLFNFEQQVDNNLSYGFNINARIPIFSQFQTKNKVAEAKYNIQSSQLQYDVEFQNQMKIFNKAYLDYTASQKKFDVSKSSLYSNQINYDTEKLKYEAGRIALQELNTSKSNLVSSISNNVKEKYEMLFNSLVLKIYDGSFLK